MLGPKPWHRQPSKTKLNDGTRKATPGGLCPLVMTLFFMSRVWRQSINVGGVPARSGPGHQNTDQTGQIWARVYKMWTRPANHGRGSVES